MIRKIIFILLPFLYLFVLLFQIDQSMLEDLGRHLRMGEAILNCHCVPQTNLFSYTNPNFPVINHEWLTQVILFFFYKNFGLQSLLILKMVILTTAFAIIYYLAKQKSSTFWLTIFSLLAIMIFSSRFRVRPEMFSYLFISLFLLILNMYNRHCDPEIVEGEAISYDNRLLRRFHLLAMTKYVLFLLPLIQLLWVNMHIYFILGIMIYVTFLIEKIVFYSSSLPALPRGRSRTSHSSFFSTLFHFARRITSDSEFRMLFFVFGLLLLTTLINPNTIKGALLPFTFSSNYGLSVEENMSVFDVGKYAPSFIYTLMLQIVTFEILVGLFLITLPILFKKNSLANSLNGLIAGLLGFRYVRSASLFGLFGLLPLSEKFTVIENEIKKRTDRYFVNTLKGIIFIATLIVVFVYIKGLYQYKVLHFGYQPYAEDATNFINNNNLKGPIFNNYHIGNYLIYGLYPKEKIFIDARPEMYPAPFLQEYERMLVNQDFFNQQVKRYTINLIVFGVQLEDPLTIRPFILRQIQSKEWIPIFADGNVTVLIKNDPRSRDVIEKFGMKI